MRVDRAWSTFQLASNQIDLHTGRDKLAQLRYVGLCPGAARRPWSRHLQKSLNENANLIAIDAGLQSEFPT
jgi:hypothetical protein